MKPNPRFDPARYPVPISHHLPIWSELADTLSDSGSYCGLSWHIEDRKIDGSHRLLLGGEIGWRFVEVLTFKIPTPGSQDGGVMVLGAAMDDLSYRRRVLATSLAAASTLLMYADTIIDVERDVAKKSGIAPIRHDYLARCMESLKV